MPLRDLLRFQPLYQTRVWGGRSLATTLGRSLPGGPPVGESWEIVDRPEAQSVVAGGPLGGRSLRSVMEEFPADLMGPGWPGTRAFPLLVKWLDCRERLSLQVHPPAAIAAELGGEPKTENWYIAEATPDASLIVGLRRGVTREQFERALARQCLETCLHRFRASAGDSLLVRSGQVHAIDAGNLILEIQQNSDTTYRVYDWGRVGLDGRPREMHVAQSLRSIDWQDFEPAPVRASPTSGIIADCPEFRIRRCVLPPGGMLTLSAGEQPRLLSLVDGGVRVRLERAGGAASTSPRLFRGDNCLLPFSAGVSVMTGDAPATVLVSENFSRS